MEKAKGLKMTEETPESSSSERVVDLAEITTRRIRSSDLDDLVNWALDDELNSFRPFFALPSREEARDHIKNNTNNPWSKVICIKDKAIGAINIASPSSGNYDICRAELWFCLDKKYWSKGIMTKVVGMVISTLFKECPHLERLEATVEVDNVASQRVLEKVGFKREAVLREYRILKGRTVDLVMFSFLSSDLHVDLSFDSWF